MTYLPVDLLRCAPLRFSLAGARCDARLFFDGVALTTMLASEAAS